MPANRPLPGQAIPGMPDIDPRAGQFQQAFHSMVASPGEHYRWERDQAIAKQNAAARRQVSQDMFGMMQRQRQMEQRRAQEQQRRMVYEMMQGGVLSNMRDLQQRYQSPMGNSPISDVRKLYSSPEDWGVDPGWLEGAQGPKAREWIEGQYLNPDFNRRVTTEDFWDEARRIDSYE